jgi:AcrR family transcriptional regulator
MTNPSARERILDAIVALHQEVGPADTTITAVAERAEVQRLTVYRHFPDEAALIRGCSQHWSKAHPPPDPGVWAGIQDPEERMQVALTHLYRFYQDGQEMLTQVLRDEEKVPPLQEALAPFRAYLAEVVGALAAGWGVKGEDQRALRTLVGLALRFDTWRSLAEEGLDIGEAARLMTRVIKGQANP